MAQNIDQFINDFWHRIIKEMQLHMGERYPLYINCHGIENLSYCLKNDVFQLLREVERPWPIVRCEYSPYNLINALGPFPSFCNHDIFFKLNFCLYF